MTKSHKLGQKKVKLGNEKQSELHNRIKAAKGGSYESSETVSQLSKQKWYMKENIFVIPDGSLLIGDCNKSQITFTD